MENMLKNKDMMSQVGEMMKNPEMMSKVMEMMNNPDMMKNVMSLMQNQDLMNNIEKMSDTKNEIDILDKGTQIKLINLKNINYNNKIGIINSYENNRYSVTLLDDKKTISIKPENCEIIIE